jgi:hypothetical protein
MDSKMECMRGFIEKDRSVDSAWTSYVSSLDRSVLKKSKYLDDRPVESPTPAVVPQQAAAVAAAVAQPAPQPQRPVFQRATSAFAEKLKGALGGRDTQ